MTSTASPVTSRIAATLEEHIKPVDHTLMADVAVVTDCDALSADLVTVVDELIAEAVADAIRERSS
jgi:hypothetical protein